MMNEMVASIRPSMNSPIHQLHSWLRYTGRMGRIRWWRVLVAAMLVMPDGAGFAQQPQPAATDTDSPSIRIDAIVTDTQGRPILNLDRQISNSLKTVSLARSSRFSCGRFRRRRPRSRRFEPRLTKSRAARQPGTRVFGFVLDEFHVSAGPASDRARAAINEFIDQNLRPEDLAIVIKPLDSVAVIRFTRDRAVLHGAVDSLSGRRGDYTPRTHFEELYIGRAPAAVATARRQIVGAVLRELTMRVGEMKADRGVVVLVSEGFPRDASPSGRSARIPELDGVARAANRYHLPIYTLNP